MTVFGEELVRYRSPRDSGWHVEMKRWEVECNLKANINSHGFGRTESDVTQEKNLKRMPFGRPTSQ